MPKDFLKTLPARQGHFLLESGYHTDFWLTLDGLFVAPNEIAPLVAALASRLRSYSLSGVCGSLLGGAFLAQGLAAELGVRFYFTEPEPDNSSDGLFSAEYRLPPGLRQRVSGERVAAVDNVISAGSSVRATVKALTAAGASTVAVGTFVVLGNVAADYLLCPFAPVPAGAFLFNLI